MNFRDIGRDGCGSFYIFCVGNNASNQEIGDIASEIWTKEMKKREELNNLCRYSFFYQPKKWRSVVKVVEMVRTILPPDEFAKRHGRNFTNKWRSKRKGLTLKIKNSFIKIKFQNGDVYEGNGYRYCQ